MWSVEHFLCIWSCCEKHEKVLGSCKHQLTQDFNDKLKGSVMTNGQKIALVIKLKLNIIEKKEDGGVAIIS